MSSFSVVGQQHHGPSRRAAFSELGAAAASLIPHLDGDELQRVVSVFNASSRVDAQTIEHIDAVLRSCRRQDDSLGPQAVLATVLAQRDLARVLVPECPAELRPRMLSALSEASRQAGWLSFDLKQFDDAGYYYDDARTRAHEAENIEQGAFVLCQMSHLATWQGTPRIGIDHAVAAGQWAHRTDDIRLRAYTADVAARAYAADGQRDACMTALDTAQAAVTEASDQIPSLSTCSEAGHIAIRGGCYLTLHEPEHVVSYARNSLETLDRSFARDVAMTIVDLSDAYAQLNSAPGWTPGGRITTPARGGPRRSPSTTPGSGGRHRPGRCVPPGATAPQAWPEHSNSPARPPPTPTVSTWPRRR